MNTKGDRAYGALVGGAIGDAMGMPASFMTVKEIQKTYGYIEDFLEPVKEAQEKHGALHAAEITDDTMETVLLCHNIIKNRGFSEEAFNKSMMEWAIENKMLESTVIGPSTRRYLEALISGKDPRLTSGKGNTNGSAMRVAPIGIAYHDNMSLCIEKAVETSLPSHGSKPAVAAACAVAAAVAAGVHGGYSINEVLEAAYEAALYGEKRGQEITAPSVARRIRHINYLVDNCGNAEIQDILEELTGVFGASMLAYESVPLSLGAFYAVSGNAKNAVLAAVNAGDDADTNGSICGNISGAYTGASEFPQEWKERVEKTSSLDIKKMAMELLNLNLNK